MKCKIIFIFAILINLNLFTAQYGSLSARQGDTADYEKTEIDDAFIEEGFLFKFSGKYNNLFILHETDNYRGDNLSSPCNKKLISDLKRIRLSPELRYSDTLTIHIDYDNEIIMSSFNKSHEFDAYWRPSDYNDAADLTWEPKNTEDIFYRTKIHRAYAKFIIQKYTLTLGRQQVRFGSGKLWNPLDILNPIAPTFVEGAEEQKGTDAFRVDRYIGESTEITAVYSQKRYENSLRKTRLQNSNSLVRLKSTFSLSGNTTDLALLGGWISNRWVCGTDIAAVLFDGMMRGSIIYSRPDDYSDFIQAGAGYEYTFTNGVSLLFEYFFNQSALNVDTELRQDYTNSLTTGTDQKNYIHLSNRFLTMNQHYAGIASGYDITPLLRGDLFIIVDFQGSGFFENISLKYNIFENLDLTASMMTGQVSSAGRSSDFDEFSNHYLYYFSLSLYF